ncbi:MAG: class I SAM-dependent methyltransferase [Chloroflexi bacterium]|nr:class I SAM-dependent methyltransferase [Chloroflexota bacterium]
MNAIRNVAEAFSRKAFIYDAFGENHPNLTRMRETVYRHALDFLRPDDHILEINAGTGTDAIFFARAGMRVHATDLAPAMVARIEQKIVQHNLRARLTVEQCSFTELDHLRAESFDAIFSNFGGLNCIADLRAATRQFPRVLRAGGIATCVIMPPFCLWDLAAIVKGDFRTATRRLRGKTIANIEGVPVATFYFSPRQVADAFGDSFRVERVQGLSIFAPPADRKNFAQRFSRAYRLLVALDERVATRRPFRAWGDFFIITLRYGAR